MTSVRAGNELNDLPDGAFNINLILSAKTGSEAARHLMDDDSELCMYLRHSLEHSCKPTRVLYSQLQLTAYMADDPARFER